MWHGNGYERPSTEGATLRIYDSTMTKYLELSHNGTNAVIDTSSGTIVQSDTENVTNITAPTGQHLTLNTTSADKNVRINSQTFTTNASIVGMQCKPRAGILLTSDICGGEFSPGLNDTFGGATVIGLNVDPILKGTTGDLSGDYRAMNVEVVADDGGNRAIGGNVSAFRVRMAFSSGTITGITSVMRIETPETQTRSKNYDCVFQFPTENTGKWVKHTGSGRAFSSVIGSGGDQAAYIRVRIGDTYYKIPCMNEA